MRFEKGDEVFLVTDSPETAGKFDDYGVEYGDRGIIKSSKRNTDRYDYSVEFESYNTKLMVAHDEISKTKCKHKTVVYSDDRQSWVCPFCDI